MRARRFASMPVIGPDGRRRIRRVVRPDGTVESRWVFAPVVFEIDQCERCGIGSGVTLYGGEPFVHRSRRLVRGEWWDTEGKKPVYRRGELCEECYEDVTPKVPDAPGDAPAVRQVG